MTLPDERSWAVVRTKWFLRSLLDPKKTPRPDRVYMTVSVMVTPCVPWASWMP